VPLYDADGYTAILQGLLPTGAVWPRDTEAVLTKLLASWAAEFARVDGRADDLVDEADPRTTLEMLSDWERVCGLPDACSGLDADTVAKRRGAVAAKLTERGGQTPAYFAALAAALGYPITVHELRAFTTESTCDENVGDDVWAFAWEVWASGVVRGYLAADGFCSDPLSWWGNETLECMIRAAAPAHTLPLFIYEHWWLTEDGQAIATEDGEQIVLPI